jgi:hypothetical protein
MRHRLVLAIAAAALAVVSGATAAGPNLGTTTKLEVGEVSFVTSLSGGNTTLSVKSPEGDTLRKASYAGAWGLPLVTLNGDVGGISRNGRVIVLSEARNVGTPLRSTTKFLVLDTGKLHLTRKITFPGDFAFDALSPNGRLLYLIEHHVASDVSQYRVRAYNLATGRLFPGAIVDKREADEPMTGFPTARVATPDGRRVFTLYTSAHHPFVHLLDTVSRAAFCIDLPTTNPQAIERASLALSKGGGKLSILGYGNIGALHVVNTKTLRVS